MDKLAKKKILLVLLSLMLVFLLFILIHFLKTAEAPDILFLKQPKYLYSIYGSEAVGPLSQPLSVAVESDKVYVADTGNSRIAVFDKRGKPLFSFSKAGEKKLIRPNYLAVYQGRIYVSDSVLGGIFVFSAKGKFLRRFEPITGKGFVWNPLALTFDGNGNLYATDKGLNRVLKFDRQGKLVLKFGKTGIADRVNLETAKFYFANGIAVDSDGKIYVSDSNNRRIQVFDYKGNFLKVIATGGLPRGIALLRDEVFVVNSFNHYIQAFDKQGNRQFNFGEYGIGDQQFQFPNDVKIEGRRFYIVDSGNDRVQVWLY